MPQMFPEWSPYGVEPSPRSSALPVTLPHPSPGTDAHSAMPSRCRWS